MLLTLIEFLKPLISAFTVPINELSILLAGGENLASNLIKVGICGGLVTGLVFGRRRLVAAFNRRFTVTVIYEDRNSTNFEQEAFDETLNLIYAQSNQKRRFELKRKFSRTREGQKETRKLTITDGAQWLLIKGRPVKVTYTKDFKEYATIRTLCFVGYFSNEQDILQFFKEPPKTSRVRYSYTLNNVFDWDTNGRSTKTAIVEKDYFLPSRIKGAVDKAIDTYLSDKESNLRKGITNKLNMFFYGPPGTGKTILGHYVAKRLKKNMIVPLGEGGLECNRIAVREDAICFLDELEGVVVGPSYDQATGVWKRELTEASIKNFLALLDGSKTVDNQVIVMTTNNPGLFGDAFYRNSRINLKLFIDLYYKEDLKEWVEWYFGEVDASMFETFPENFRFRPCDLAHFYGQYSDNVEDFLHAVRTYKIETEVKIIKNEELVENGS